MAPTNILVAGSMNGQGVGEWVGNLLWLGCVAAGMFTLCVAVVWATQEKQVALRSGGHRRIIRSGSRNPWLKKIRRMTERVGTWLMKISRPQGEPGHRQGRRGTRAVFATTMQSEPGDREDLVSRPGHPNLTRVP
ncbi:hypothetical protein K438DRAFT_1769838 [Mycena galopus ATCC 62051]|nr:hypothetical protein K438DRAFT_1769838 [Mycena galopus ATCC 62051]